MQRQILAGAFKYRDRVKVFISVDMEGVSGVTDPEDVLPNGAEYQT